MPLGERQVNGGLSRMFASFLGCSPKKGLGLVSACFRSLYCAFKQLFFFFFVFYQELSIVELRSQPPQCRHRSPAQPLAHQAPVEGERGCEEVSVLWLVQSWLPANQLAVKHQGRNWLQKHVTSVHVTPLLEGRRNLIITGLVPWHSMKLDVNQKSTELLIHQLPF